MVLSRSITSETIAEWLFTLEKVNLNMPPELSYRHRENLGDLTRYLELKQIALQKNRWGGEA